MTRLPPMRRSAIFAALLLGAPAHADFAADEFPPHERCALCHGLYGVSVTDRFPHLAGQRPAYLKAQIAAFLEGRRTNDGGQMQAVVTELGVADIPAVIGWFSEQEPPAPAEPGDIPDGRAAFAGMGCAGCHDEAAAGPAVPRLSAQHAAYLAKQMRDFRGGARDGTMAELHRSALAVSDDRIKAISAYLAAEARP